MAGGLRRFLLLLVVGMCFVELIQSAPPQGDDLASKYEEPPMEGTTEGGDDEEGSGQDMEEGSGEEDEESGEDDNKMGDDDEEGSGEDKDDMMEDDEDETDTDKEEDEDSDGEEKEGDDEENEDGDEEKEDMKDDEKEDDDAEKEEDDDEKDDDDAEKDDEMSKVEDASCPAKSTKDCEVAKALKAVVDYIKLLGEEVGELRQVVKTSCKAKLEDDDTSEEDKEGSGDDMESSEDDGSGDEKMDSDEEDDHTGEDMSEESKEDMDKDDGDDMDEDDKSMEKEDDDTEEDEDDDKDEDDASEETDTTTLPPPPERCPPPFQLLANSCYYIQTDSREWRSWGDANAFCQQQGGFLAAPYRSLELMEYLHQSYSGAIWVGAQQNNGVFEWTKGRPITEKEWKNGKPNPHPARKCILLDSRDRYLATNFFCGEKFSFICEHRGVDPASQDYY